MRHDERRVALVSSQPSQLPLLNKNTLEVFFFVKLPVISLAKTFDLIDSIDMDLV